VDAAEGELQVSVFDGKHQGNLEKLGTVSLLTKHNPLVTCPKTDGNPCFPCQYFKGYRTGVLSAIWERKANCAKTRCLGDEHPHCEFTIT
jgi:hypothetical protein